MRARGGALLTPLEGACLRRTGLASVAPEERAEEGVLRRVEVPRGVDSSPPLQPPCKSGGMPANQAEADQSPHMSSDSRGTGSADLLRDGESALWVMVSIPVVASLRTDTAERARPSWVCSAIELSCIVVWI